MKVKSFKSAFLIGVCVWAVTGAVAFWAGNQFGTNGKLVANAGKNSKGNSKDALQAALEKAILDGSKSTKDPGALTEEQLLSLKGKVDPAAVARWAASLNPTECAKEMADLQKLPAGAKRDAMLSALYDSWAKQDPQGFLASSGKMTNPLAREASTTKALNAWAAQDPKAALDWLTKNPGATAALQTQEYDAIIAGFAANNPAQALSFVNALPDGATPGSAEARAKISAMQALVSGMADQGNFADALTMIGQLPPNSQLQSSAYSQLLASWVANSPSDAAQWVSSLDPTQFPQMRQYASTLVQNWALSDPLAAAAWAAQQDAQQLANNPNGGPGGGRGGRGGGGNLLSTAVGQMVAAGDVDVAGTYLNTLQAGPEKDSAVAAFITGAASEDPAGAMNWINTISNPNMQSRMTNVVAATWLQQDPNGFNQYLGTLDPSVAAQLQQAAQNNFGGGFGPGGGGPGGGRGGRNGGFAPGGGGVVTPGAGVGTQGGPAVTFGNGGGSGGRRGGRGGRGGGG